ncbi:NADH dehydrogenase [ubiquinone] 1 beta subcomplex subunit 8, mitochondrial [Smittium mucronatum]|uniref:NADH dehydrogenase [ubiquinone] 1 beta subcomplex subunit 8, mitochondrial n=1 Tax=Smittium mucronatum TaxID=133383 RepID=A0A1R0GZN3_9FUNG|nr:NADH dehydrogenase [ubiquinone] 1 beta subcomplex subunit 8, mitochondrial [Smittium mucronatum]
MNRINPSLLKNLNRAGLSLSRFQPSSIAQKSLILQSVRGKGDVTYKKKYYVDEDPQAGDYPNLPWIRSEEKTPYGWWDRQYRRNFGDTLHEHEDILNMQSVTVYYHPPWSIVLGQWVAFVSLLGAGAYLVYFLVPEPVAVPKFYPYNGLEKEMGGLANRSLTDSIEIAQKKL